MPRVVGMSDMYVPDLASNSCPAPPKLSEIVHILKSLEDKYHELGVQLDVGIDQLKQIEGEHRGNSRRFSETIGLWQNKSANCSWSSLADAVERVGGYDNLVRELRARDNNCFTGSCSHNSPLHCHDDTENSEDTGYSTKSDSAAGDSSGSEIEHFDKVPGCGCDKPCSIYTLCAEGCPRPTNKKVGMVRKRVEGQATQDVLLPEEEAEAEEDYAEKFEKETRNVRTQFARLVNNTCRSFKKRNVTTTELILYLQNAHPLALKPRIDEMSKAVCLEQVFTIVTSQACSWFDYEVMKDVVDYLGDADDKKRLDQYEANFRIFAEQRLPKGKKHIEVGSGARKGGKQLVIKIDKEWDEVNFSDLDKIRGNLASIFGTRRSDLYLADIREGCIMVTFMITEELLFPNRSGLTSSRLSSNMTPSQIKSLKNEGVILLTCGNLSWRPTTEQKEPELQSSEVSLLGQGGGNIDSVLPHMCTM